MTSTATDLYEPDFPPDAHRGWAKFFRDLDDTPNLTQSPPDNKAHAVAAAFADFPRLVRRELGEVRGDGDIVGDEWQA